MSSRWSIECLAERNLMCEAGYHEGGQRGQSAKKVAGEFETQLEEKKNVWVGG